MLEEMPERVTPIRRRSERSSSSEGSDAAGSVPPSHSALGRIARALASGTAFADLVREIAECSAHALGADVAVIRALAPEGNNFVVVAASGPSQLHVAGMIGSYSVVSDEIRAADIGAVTTIDLAGEAGHAPLASNERWDYHHLGTRHLMVVPLHAQGELVGRLDLLRISLEPFGATAREAVMAYAAFAAAALRERKLSTLAEDHRAFQSVIGLHQSVEQPADPRTILQAVVELVVREPGCSRCYAMLWHPDRGEFIPTAVAGLDPQLVDILKLITLSPQLVPAFDQMIHSRRPLVVSDATRSTLLPASLVRALGIRAAMIVPLRGRRHETIGVLLLDQEQEGVSFTDQQVAIMAGMSRHLSMMLENAILFEEVRTSSESMAVINEIAIQLAMLTDEESLFRQLSHQLSSVLDASQLAMGLLTPDRRAMDVRYSIESVSSPRPTRVTLGDDPLSIVARTGRYDLVGTREGADAAPWQSGTVSVDPTHSRLTVPITVGRNVIGSLMVESPFRNAYGPRDVELLTSVALHTGIAIENARLYRLVQSRGDRRAVVLDEVIHRQEAERKELVDNIHDDTLQVLASCLYRLDRAQEAVEQLGREEQVLVQISDVRDSLSENIARLRKRIFSLRPATLDRLGLEPALRELLGSVSRETGIAVELDVQLAGRLTSEHEMVAYRLIQEALVHIRTRGGASRLRLRIRQRAGVVSITIHDDGGPDPQVQEDAEEADDSRSERSDITLLALIERAELAGGHMRVAHRAGGGSLMQITIPGTIRQMDLPFNPDDDDWTMSERRGSLTHENEEHRGGF